MNVVSWCFVFFFDKKCLDRKKDEYNSYRLSWAFDPKF